MLRTVTACAFALSTMCAANAGQTGIASHYSTRDKNQNGSRTASGRLLRDHELTGAHRSLPFGSKLRVTGSNGRSVVVTITDRGPSCAVASLTCRWRPRTNLASTGSPG